MVAVWILFAALLFVLEPLIVHRVIDRRASSSPEATLTLMLRFHRVMLGLALLAILALSAVHMGFSNVPASTVAFGVLYALSQGQRGPCDA